ncbi:MAG: hypothetical protein WD834_02015 [Actinomycetota bacterium]
MAAAEALAHGESQRSVCRTQAIPRSVLAEWLKKQEFTSAIEEFRQAILAEVKGKLLRLLPSAAEALTNTIGQQPQGPPSYAERTRAVEVALKATGVLAGSAGGAIQNAPGGVQLIITPEVMALADQFIARAHGLPDEDPDAVRAMQQIDDAQARLRVIDHRAPEYDAAKREVDELRERARARWPGSSP